jgi:colicin import membrane protein
MRVSVLLRLEPGTYGIRRKGPKVADPVLCTLAGCYIGMGAAAPAQFLPGHMALGIANTFGGRAGACRQSLGCVFRGVELGHAPFYLQPVDLHIFKHDRRRGQVLTEDSDCAAEAGRLRCSRGIYAEDYAMWIVPESIAAAAGPEALERALASGLNGPRSATLAPPMTAF